MDGQKRTDASDTNSTIKTPQREREVDELFVLLDEYRLLVMALQKMPSEQLERVSLDDVRANLEKLSDYLEWESKGLVIPGPVGQSRSEDERGEGWRSMELIIVLMLAVTLLVGVSALLYWGQM